MLDIKRSNIEIRELKESFESLNLSHTEMKKSHADVTKELQKIKAYQKDSTMESQINKILEDWKNIASMFIITRPAKHLPKSIKENSCVTIIASSGVGKTATLRHVALQMSNEEYDVIIVSDPGHIIKFYNPNKKTLFVIDDLCGNFSVFQSDIKSWDPLIERIKEILINKQTKIIAACRLQVFQDEKFGILSVFKSCACNMLSEEIRLTKTEKKSIAELYMKSKASEIADYYDLYDCFPLLCKMFHDNPNFNVANLFQKPFSVYESEIDKLFQMGLHTKYCALALCVMFNNELKEEMLTKDVDTKTKMIIKKTCQACKLDKGTSRLVIRDELDSLTHTFIRKVQEKFIGQLQFKNYYKAFHDKIFDFLAYYFGQKIIECFVKNADCCLIKEKFLLEKKDVMDPFITVVPQIYHQMYIQRMIDDWSIGKLHEIFRNINMKIPQFRKKFLFHLTKLDTTLQRQLAHTYENKCQQTTDYWFFGYDKYDTVLLHCCLIGDIHLIQWCLNHDVDVNKCAFDNQSPVMIASEHCRTEIVRMLLDRGVDCNIFDIMRKSALMKASEHGHTEIVKMLLDEGADFECDHTERFPVMFACEGGHTEIVRILLHRGAVCNKVDFHGRSPVMMACEGGHTEIVQMLIHRGADLEKYDIEGRSPVIKACACGQKEIVKMLIDRDANINNGDDDGKSPLYMACKNGFTNIVKMLIDGGANVNSYDNNGKSPLQMACKHGFTEIVRMLLDRGLYYNTSDNEGCTPLLKACERGHTEIVKMLLDGGVYYNKSDNEELTPFMSSCIHGHSKIVQILIDSGADFEIYDKLYQSPVMKACEHGQADIVKILLNRGLDYNECNNHDKGEDYNKFDIWGKSPVMFACKHGHTEIVKILLDKSVDYNKSDKRNQSPIIVACLYCYSNIVKMLLKGTDYNKCDNHNKSPIMKACKYGHTDIVKMLLEIGVDCDNHDILRQSSLMKACKHGHTDIVGMLLDSLVLIITQK
ncbi:unnamed protein product [Mytilus coruscus]|uniref:Novel STAND NTPase 3 domain-containing protein n=1 Tax=Mytilus coruscus TaxID=42192 RepID=A0A6J8A6C4_MYTCO|nr:unnamed protein product [Mytilus coruscus]